MINKSLITSRQAFLLIVLANISTAVLFVPTTPVEIVNQDGWIPVILSTFFAALLLYYPLGAMCKKYPEHTIIQYSPLILGRFIGKLFAALFIYYFFIIHCLALREFGELVITFMPETSINVPIIFISLISIYTVKCGLEVMGRCAEIIFPLGFISLFIIGLFSIEQGDYTNLQPFMESSIMPLMIATLSPLDWLSLGLVFGIFAPCVNNKRSLVKIGIYAVFLSGAILTIFSIINILVFGSDLLKILNYPLLILSRVSKFEPFERIEVFIILLWVSWVFIRVSLFSYATVLGLSQLFNFTDHRFLIVPENLLAIAYSLFMYDSFVEMSYAFSISQLYYISIPLGLTIILWLTSIIRSKMKT